MAVGAWVQVRLGLASIEPQVEVNGIWMILSGGMLCFFSGVGACRGRALLSSGITSDVLYY